MVGPALGPAGLWRVSEEEAALGKHSAQSPTSVRVYCGALQPLQCAAVVKLPELGSAAVPCRWFVGFAVLPVSGDFVEEEAALGNPSVRSPVSVWVASPGHVMGHCKVKCGLCCVQQEW